VKKYPKKTIILVILAFLMIIFSRQVGIFLGDELFTFLILYFGVSLLFVLYLESVFKARSKKGSAKLIISIFVISMIVAGYLAFNKFKETTPESSQLTGTTTNTKTIDTLIANGAKFEAEIITKPIVNTGIPIQFKIINGIQPPDPEMCVLNITINDELVLDNETCVEENETIELIFDYESEENENTWNIFVFYSVDGTIYNLTLTLIEEVAEEGSDISFIINLPNTVERGKDIVGSGTFNSDSTKWISAQKIVLIIMNKNNYYKFVKELNMPVPPKFSYTADYTTKLPEEADPGNYTVQTILYYTEDEIERAISNIMDIEII